VPPKLLLDVRVAQRALLGRQRAVRAQDAPQEREGRAQRRGVAGAGAGGAGGEGGGEAEGGAHCVRIVGAWGSSFARREGEVVEEILRRACGGPGRRNLISTAGSAPAPSSRQDAVLRRADAFACSVLHGVKVPMELVSGRNGRP
jgi:hypothetical protein